MIEKQALRSALRESRTAEVAAIPDGVKALLFRVPPSPLSDLIPPGATIGVYDPVGSEAPPTRYAQWYFERGHQVALPWFAARGAAMQFRLWSNPLEEELLAPAPYGGRQPLADAGLVVPDVLFVPLLGFTADGVRLGQGGGHYDRFLAQHPAVVPIGIAWDSQLRAHLPTEPHDIPLHAVATPSRLYGPF
jgi:5-formyltetrahydrofolate cyclo-ligase